MRVLSIARESNVSACLSFDSSIFYVSLNLGLFVFVFEFVERRGFVVVSI